MRDFWEESGALFKRIVPLSGVISPAMMESKVDFPQPEGPTIAMNSPGLMVKEMSEGGGDSEKEAT